MRKFFLLTVFFLSFATGSSLEVIGAGFGRTGTASVQAALNILYEQEGRQCYHFGSIVSRPSHMKRWTALLKGEVSVQDIDWEKDFFDEERFAAAVDHPVADFYEELLEAYPHAKVILTVHPGGREAWYKSKLAHQELSKCFGRWPAAPIARIVFPFVLMFLFPTAQIMSKSVWTGYNDVLELVKATELNVWGAQGVEDEDNALGIYDEWYEDVPTVVSHEKLMIYNVSDGWEPLCRFLGRPIPDRPFPREEAHSSRNIKSLISKLELILWCIYGILCAVALLAIGRFFVRPTRKLEKAD